MMAGLSFVAGLLVSPYLSRAWMVRELERRVSGATDARRTFAEARALELRTEVMERDARITSLEADVEALATRLVKMMIDEAHRLAEASRERAASGEAGE
jgi:hypothetical protein